MTTHNTRLGKLSILCLALLTAVGPLATDMYLSALPIITESLGTTATMTQLTLSAFMVGMAVGQFLAGPLSDKIGRLKPLYVGVILSWLSAIACIFAPSIELLIAARIVMGVSGATGLVIARAMVADSTRGNQTAKLMGILMMINGFAPIFAPVMGGLVLEISSWRGIFVLLACFMTLSMVLSFTVLRESLPPEKRRTGSIFSSYRGIPEVLALPRYRGFMLTSTLAFGTLFAYVSGSSYVLQNVLGVSALEFTLIFGMNSVGIVGMSALVTFLVGRVAMRKMLTIGVVSMTAVCLLLTASFILGPTLIPTIILMFLTTCSAGLIFSNASSLALMEGRRKAGAASATLGTVQSIFGAIVPALVAVGGTSAVMPMALTMLGFALASALMLFTTPIKYGDWTKEGAEFHSEGGPKTGELPRLS